MGDTVPLSPLVSTTPASLQGPAGKALLHCVSDWRSVCIFIRRRAEARIPRNDRDAAPTWPRFEIAYRYRFAAYHASRQHGRHWAKCPVDRADGKRLAERRAPLQDDPATHAVRVRWLTTNTGRGGNCDDRQDDSHRMSPTRKADPGSPRCSTTCTKPIRQWVGARKTIRMHRSASLPLE